MTHRHSSPYRVRAVALLLVLGAGIGAGRWGLEVRPRVVAAAGQREQLEVERRRLAETRAQLLRHGSDGILARNRVLRAEVERREALAPAGTVESAGPLVRERFAALAARYGVHAPTFEQMPVQTLGELQIGGVRIRAAGGYHALGTWITEGLSEERLLDLREARLEAVPDSLTGALRGAVEAAPEAAPAGALELSGAAPLDAVVEMVVQWYALSGAAASAEVPEVEA